MISLERVLKLNKIEKQKVGRGPRQVYAMFFMDKLFKKELATKETFQHCPKKKYFLFVKQTNRSKYPWRESWPFIESIVLRNLVKLDI